MWPPWVGGFAWPEQAPLPGRPHRAAPTKFSYLSAPRRPPRRPPLGPHPNRRRSRPDPDERRAHGPGLPPESLPNRRRLPAKPDARRLGARLGRRARLRPRGHHALDRRRPHDCSRRGLLPGRVFRLAGPQTPPPPPPGLGIGRGPLPGGDDADPRALRLARLAVVRLRILDARPLRAPHGHLRPALRLPARPDLPPGGPGTPALPPGAGPPRPPGDSGIAHPSLPRLPLADRWPARRRSALPDRPAPRSPGRRLDGPRPPPLDAGTRRRLLPLFLPVVPLLPGAAGPLPGPLPHRLWSRSRRTGPPHPAGLGSGRRPDRPLGGLRLRRPPARAAAESRDRAHPRPLRQVAGEGGRMALPADDALRPRACPGAGPAHAGGGRPGPRMGPTAGHGARPPAARERLPGRPR